MLLERSAVLTDFPQRSSCVRPLSFLLRGQILLYELLLRIIPYSNHQDMSVAFKICRHDLDKLTVERLFSQFYQALQSFAIHPLHPFSGGWIK